MSPESTRSAGQFHKSDETYRIKLSEFVEKTCELTPVKLSKRLPFPAAGGMLSYLSHPKKCKEPALQGTAPMTVC